MASTSKKASRPKGRNVMATIKDLLAAKLAAVNGAGARQPAMMPGGGAAPSPMSMMPGANAMTQ